MCFECLNQYFIFLPNNYKTNNVEESADILLLQSSTLALGLAEGGIWVWASELVSLRVYILMWT